MAEASVSAEQDSFRCSICLQLLKDPVTTPCGHNFCMGCLNGYWDHGEQKGAYSCPQCRETFKSRPELRRNNLLEELLVTLQKINGQDSFSTFLDFSFSSAQDVECDSCIGEKKRAVKSCLTCLASYCDTHILPHHEAEAFKKHKLVMVVANLQDKICAQHNKILDIFCRTDQKAICYECSIGKHEAHDTTSVQDEWMLKKKLFVELQMKHRNRLETREKTLLELNGLVKSFKCSAQTAVEDSEKTFTALVDSMKNRLSQMTMLIRDQEKVELDRASELQEQLEQEIAKLQRKGTRLEQLSHTDDYVHFLQCFEFLKSDLETDDTFKVDFNQQWQFEHCKTSVFQLKEEVESFCKEKCEMLSKYVTIGQIIPVPEPETREEFLKYFCELSLDPNTVNNNLSLSDGDTQVTCSGQTSSYPDHPERFTHWQQVLCKQGLPQRCYWEAEVRGENGVSIAVSYREIQRKSSDTMSRFGHNSISWRLVCYPQKYIFWHNNIQVAVSGPASKRIGVYLDQKKGNLSFYSVSDRMTLLHKATSTFTQLLYLGFGLGHRSYVKICLQAQADGGAAAAESVQKK